MHKLISKPGFETKFLDWQNPDELLHRSKKYIAEVGNEAFLSKGEEHEKTVQEALIASTFSCCLSRKICIGKIRMVEQGTILKDFEIEHDRSILEIEVTVAYERGYKIREAWRGGQSPEIPRYAYSGDPNDPIRLAGAIQKKTQKACNAALNTKRHLVVYSCMWGGLPNLGDLRNLCDEADRVWASVWVISGVPSSGGVGLLFNAYGFDWPMMGWLSYVNARKGGGFGGFDIYLQ